MIAKNVKYLIIYQSQRHIFAIHMFDKNGKKR